MKIALCGSHGSGKTTLAELLSKKIQAYPLTQSVTTLSAISMGFCRPSEIPLCKMKEFQWVALFRQHALEDMYSSFVTHRSPIDYLAYFMFQVPGAHRESKEYASACLSRLKSYDAVFILPVTSRGEDDGKRHLGNEDLLDNWIRLIISRPDEFTSEKIAFPPMFEIKSDGPEKRALEAVEHLNAIRAPQRKSADII